MHTNRHVYMDKYHDINQEDRGTTTHTILHVGRGISNSYTDETDHI